MDLVLHSYRRCPFAIRVRMVLEEKGIPYQCVEESLASPSATLLRHHPQGKVPLLLHGGVPLYESAVITEYLDEAFPPPRLRPATALGLARMRLWTFWCDDIFKPDLDAYKYRLAALTDAQGAALLARLRGHLEKLEEALTATAYLQGETFGLADIHVFPFYRQLTRAGPDFAPHVGPAKTNAWLEKILARPSFERVMRKP